MKATIRCRTFVIAIVGLLCWGFEVRGEMIASVQIESSRKILASIESDGPVLGDLANWVAFSSNDNFVGANHSVPDSHRVDLFDSISDGSELIRFGYLELTNDLPNVGTCNNIDSASVVESHGGSNLAVCVSELKFPEPVLLRYLRGSTFIFLRDVPIFGLFRPPKSTLTNQVVS